MYIIAFNAKQRTKNMFVFQSFSTSIEWFNNNTNMLKIFFFHVHDQADFHDCMLVTKTGRWTASSDILAEKKHVVWENFTDMFSINIFATCYLCKTRYILNMVIENNLFPITIFSTKTAAV